jgi:hypothetical protein
VKKGGQFQMICPLIERGPKCFSIKGVNSFANPNVLFKLLSKDADFSVTAFAVSLTNNTRTRIYDKKAFLCSES